MQLAALESKLVSLETVEILLWGCDMLTKLVKWRRDCCFDLKGRGCPM